MPVHWDRYGWALATTLICTLVGFTMQSSFEAANIVMVVCAGRDNRRRSIRPWSGGATAIANVLAFDFCFVPPQFTFSVADAQYVVTFAVMLIVTLVIANLMASVRQQTRVAGARERRTYLLYAMSRELAATRGIAEMARVAVRHVAEVFQCQAVVLLPDASGKLKHPRDLPEAGSLRGVGPVDCAMGARSWASRGTRFGHVACGARVVSAAG